MPRMAGWLPDFSGQGGLWGPNPCLQHPRFFTGKLAATLCLSFLPSMGTLALPRGVVMILKWVSCLQSLG